MIPASSELSITLFRSVFLPRALAIFRVLRIFRALPITRTVQATFVVVGILFFTGAGSNVLAGATTPSAGTLIIEAEGVRHSFLIELAATPSTRSSGLMYRRQLAEHTGMLFDFVKTQQVTMWMKNTYLPLDMIFIDETGRIANIEQRTIPHSLKHIRSQGSVRAVLEINGGLAASLGIKPGDKVLHKIFAAAD